MTRKFFSIIAAAFVAVAMFSCEDPTVPAELRVDPESLSFAEAAESKTVNLYSAQAWTAEVTQGAQWITLSKTSGESFDGALVVSVTANEEDVKRVGKVLFKSADQSAELVVEQSGKTSPDVPAELVIPEAIMRPDVVTPVNYTPEMVEGGEDGVSIRVTAKDVNNFKFEVRPGANIQSYRLDVYPLCRLYNSLFEGAKNANINLPLNEAMVETMVRGFIFDSTGAGGYTFSVNNMDDFLSHEFDWMNTSYAQANVVPDCEYVIAAVGCFDTEGAEQGELSLCYVRTPYKELIGKPEVEISAEPGYTSVLLTYAAKQDAKYYYQWCSNEDDLMPYIDAYGDKLYSDFMRNTIGAALAANAPEENGINPHVHKINFGLGATSNFNIMATAVGLDENQTPAKEYQSKIFKLKERPADAEPANASLVVLEDYIAASLFWVECYMPADCPNAYMDLITPDEYEIYKNYDETAMNTYAMLIQQEPALGFTNWNWGMENDAQGNPIYAPCTLQECIMFGQPDTEYYIAYTAMNNYRQLSPVKFVGPFRTKALVTNAPEQSVTNLNLNLTSPAPTKVDINFTYDLATTAAIHFQYIEGFGDGYYDADGNYFEYPDENSSRETLLNYIYFDQLANRWSTDMHGFANWTDILDPDTRYTIAYVGEDWNGVLGEVKFTSVTTGELKGGDNPVAEVLGKFDENGDPYFLIQHVQDCYGVYYLASDASASGLMLENLGDKKLSFRNEAKALEAWYNYCMEYKVNNGATLGNPIRVDIASNKEVAICIPLGGTPDNTIFGEMTYLIYDNGEFYDLKHYYPEAASAPALIQRTNVGDVCALGVAKEAAREMEPVSFEESNVGTITIDPAVVASHPNARLR